MNSEMARRPLKTREKTWPRRLAFALVRLGATPNQISIASVVISIVGAFCLFLANGRAVLFIVAAICIQLRLLCNLLDGLMAVEGGLKTKAGEIFNEFPDRVADVSLFIAAGYSAHFVAGIELGYLCAIASVLTAYVRVFGGAAGLTQDYCGPMAKQQRMATLTIACVLSTAEIFLRWPHRIMPLALVIIFFGSLLTAARRTARIARLLNARR
jgi:phosphatidylglycerophosphate synthase